MATEVRDGALMTIRTARTRHWCGLGRHWIEPGDVYEDWRAPPWRGDNESDHWWRGKRHAGTAGESVLGPVVACAEADAYREAQRRMLQASGLLPAGDGAR